MTTFTRTWNASYEATPADNTAASAGAARIRDLKTDISERQKVDHSYAGDANDGAHKKVTLLEQASDPTSAANTGFVYSKDVAGATELFYEDAAGNVIQLTAAGAVNKEAFPSGTKMLFQQTAAPTGWTKDVAINDSAIRIVSGTAGSGGADVFSTVFGASKATASHTLTEAEIPAHTHTYKDPVNNTYNGNSGNAIVTAKAIGTTTTGSTGGGTGHTHNLTMDLKYTDVIVASKA